MRAEPFVPSAVAGLLLLASCGQGDEAANNQAAAAPAPKEKRRARSAAARGSASPCARRKGVRTMGPKLVWRQCSSRGGGKPTCSNRAIAPRRMPSSHAGRWATPTPGTKRCSNSVKFDRWTFFSSANCVIRLVRAALRAGR